MRLYYYIYVALAIMMMLSCSSNIQKESNSIFFPPPPDTARVQFLTSINTSNDIAGSQSVFEKFIIGATQESIIVKPYGISTSKDRLVIVDTKQSSLININLKERAFESISPKGLGSLKKPLCTAIRNDSIYVCDAGRKEIILFSKDFEFIRAFGSGDLAKPTDVCIFDNKIYVPDIENHKIYIYSGDNFKLLSSFPEEGTQENAPEFLHSPNHIYVINNMVYVTDFGEFNVKIFDISGKYLKSIGTYGNNIGQFARPKGLAVDLDGNIYVIDAAFENVQVFNSAGDLLFFFGNSGGKSGKMVLPIRIAIDYQNIDYFSKYADPAYKLKYLIYLTNQFGDEKVNVYGFLELK